MLIESLALWWKSKYAQGLLEQVTYTPAAMTSFYFLMSLMEGRSVNEAIDEVKSKFVPTYKVSIVRLVAKAPEKN